MGWERRLQLQQEAEADKERRIEAGHDRAILVVPRNSQHWARMRQRLKLDANYLRPYVPMSEIASWFLEACFRGLAPKSVAILEAMHRDGIPEKQRLKKFLFERTKGPDRYELQAEGRALIDGVAAIAARNKSKPALPKP